MLFASGFVVVANLPHLLGRPPGVVSVLSERLRLPAAQSGALSWRGVYLTRAPVQDVWRWYAVHYQAVPATGIDPAGQCMSLTSRRRPLKPDLHLTFCYTARGTRVAVTQTIYLLP
jgi:hypothetical protein